jgi:hypothetical protein
VIIGAALVAAKSDFYHGQPTALALLGIAGSFWLVSRDRILPAAVVLGLVIALKPVFLPFVLSYVWRGHYRLAGWTIATAVAAIAVSFLVLAPNVSPFTAAGDWIDNSRHFGSVHFAAGPLNLSLVGVLYRISWENFYSTPWFESKAVFYGVWLFLIAVVALLLVIAFGLPRIKATAKAGVLS